MRLFYSAALLIILNIPNALAIHHYILSDSHFACSYSEQHIHEKVDDCVIDNFITNSVDFNLTEEIEFKKPLAQYLSNSTLYNIFHTHQTKYKYSLRGPPVI